MTPELIHAIFKVQPGSEQIASVFAIRHVMRAIIRKRPLRVLEVGAGIGTLTSAACWAALRAGEFPDYYYTEDDPACLTALLANLGDVFWHYCQRLQPDDVGMSVDSFDLVIVDGEPPVYIPPLLAPRAFIVVEGNRRAWREELECYLDRTLYGLGLSDEEWARVHLKPWDRSKGVWIYQLNATPWERLTFAVRQRWQDLLDLAYIVGCRVTGREPALGKKRRAS